MSLLQVAYLVDALVSFPLAMIALFGSRETAEQVVGERLPDREVNRVMLGALWAAIAACAAAGIILPEVMSPILVLQLIYKSLWLTCYALPRWVSGRGHEVPLRVAATFLAYVAAYPWVIPWDHLRAA